MIACPNCNRKINDDAKFCSYCGIALRTAQAAENAPHTPSVSQPSPAPPVQTIQPMPPQSPVEQSSLTDAPAPRASSSQKGNLLALGALLVAAGLLLILVVAPQFTEFQRLIFNYGVRHYDPEYWMAMVGGGVCLLLGGAFFLKAITSSDKGT